MNKKQKIVFYSGLSIITASIITWIAFGREIFTKTQVLVEKKDELFPEMVYKEWTNKFIWGLDLSGLISGITIVACALLIFLFRSKKN